MKIPLAAAMLLLAGAAEATVTAPPPSAWPAAAQHHAVFAAGCQTDGDIAPAERSAVETVYDNKKGY